MNDINDIKDIKKKIKYVTEQINYHNNLYYNKDSPEISDFEYDKLLRELIDLEKKYPELKYENSPTNKIGGVSSSSFKKVKHKVFMGSLQNAYTFEEILKFEEKINEKINNSSSKIEYIVEPKIDGLSVSLEYKNGKFIKGSTRGDGFEGEDVTENLKTIETIPKNLYRPINFLEVRAEVYMPVRKFNSLVEEQKKLNQIPFKNPRNAAAGSLRQKNPLITFKRGLKAISFNIQQIESEDEKILTHSESIKFLSNLGFFVIPESKIYKNIKEAIKAIEEIEIKKNNYDFDIDGAVVKINSIAQRKFLGYTAKYPRWAIAFKYQPKEKKTKLKKIEVKVGRTGVLTPIAIFDPIDLAQTIVSKATLHNQEYIDKNDIRVGDIILVRKAGEIIPEVVKSIAHEKNSLKYTMPNFCPVCKNKVIKIKSSLVCENPSCKATVVKKIIHFVSKDAMNIEGVGEKTIKMLIEKNIINDIVGLYKLKKEDIEKLDGFKEKSIKNLLNSIEKSKKNPFWRLLFGLGIKEVGGKTAKILSKKYKDIFSLMEASKEDLIEIKDIGKTTASNIFQYFSMEQTKKLIENLKNLGLNLKNEIKKNEENSNLAGITFVITGKMNLISRQELKNLIESAYGKVTSAVSLKTDYLIVGENPGLKLEKAKRLKIKILTEKEAIDIININ